MRLKGPLLFSLVLLVFGSNALAQNEGAIVIPYAELGSHAAPYDFRSAYGRIKYNIDFAVDVGNNPPDGPSVENSLESFLRDAVVGAFGGESGSYILTIGVFSGSKEIVKKALVSFAYEQRRFLFFTTNASLTANLSRSGVLIDNFPVDLSNNNLNVQLRLQKNSNLFLNTSQFNEFSDQVSLLSFSALQPAFELLPNMQNALSIMAKVIDTQNDTDVSNDVGMRFVDSGTELPSGIVFSIRGSRGSNDVYLNGLDVSVSFEVDRSLFPNHSENGFQDVDLSTVLPFAVVGSSSAAIHFDNAIGSRSYEALRSFLASLERGSFPSDATPTSVCRELWDTLLEFFTVDDASLIYAAYLWRYAFELNVEGAKRACVDRYKLPFSRLNIPYESIDISN